MTTQVKLVFFFVSWWCANSDPLLQPFLSDVEVCGGTFTWQSLLSRQPNLQCQCQWVECSGRWRNLSYECRNLRIGGSNPSWCEWAGFNSRGFKSLKSNLIKGSSPSSWFKSRVQVPQVQFNQGFEALKSIQAKVQVPSVKGSSLSYCMIVTIPHGSKRKYGTLCFLEL